MEQGSNCCGISSENLSFMGVHQSSENQPSTIADVINMLQAESQQKQAHEEMERELNDDEDDFSLMECSGRVRSRKRLPKEIQGLMGEANLKFARGEYQEVIVMCKEIIRSAPSAPEPYQTLSMLYEEMGDIGNAYQFGLVAAHLDPRNADEWIRLAEISLDAGNLKDTEMCYRQVVKYDKENVQVMFECVRLNLELGEQKRAADVMKLILDTQTAKADGAMYVSMSKELAKLYHKQKNVDQAIEVMCKALKEVANSITSEEVNLLSEFYIETSNYVNVLNLLTEFCGVVVTQDDTAIEVPSAMPVDLKSKLMVCLAHLHKPHLVQILLPTLLEESVEEVGDLYLDLAEALQASGHCLMAKPLFSLLVQSSKYNLAAVWLRYSECLSALGEVNEALAAYTRVVDLAPNHVNARVQLSLLQQQLGLDEEALYTLAQGEISQAPDWSEFQNKEPRLLLHTCHLLYSQGKTEEFFRVVNFLLFGQLPYNFAERHESVIMAGRTYRGRVQSLRDLLPDYDNLYKQPPALVGEECLNVQECWELFTKACTTAWEMKDYRRLLVLSLNGNVTHTFFVKKSYADEMTMICLCAHILLRYGGFSFDLIRDSITEILSNKDKEDQGQVQSNQLFNLYSMITSISHHDVRFSRYTERLLIKHPESVPLYFAHGHASLMFGTYKSALNQYITIYKHMEDDPLINLLIGICFLHIVCQKFTSQRATLIVQSMCFLDKYLQLRGHCQEAYYNLGRAMHQISINSAAVYYYTKALETKPALEGEEFDLTKEAAFNLSLIYRTSGSRELAEFILQKHCVIR